MNQHKRAFTLIELLVVVLIIGILVTVVLPQYRIAVGKVRFSTMKQLADAVVKGQEVYYLANGNYTSSFENLDVNLPPDKLENSSNSVYKYAWGECKIETYVGYIRCVINEPYLGYIHYFPHSYYAGTRACFLPDSIDFNDWRNKICKAETYGGGQIILDRAFWYYPRIQY